MDLATDGVGHIPQDNATENAPIDTDTPNIHTPNYSVNPMNDEFNLLKTFPRVWTHRFVKRSLARNGLYYILENPKCLYWYLVIDATADTSEVSLSNNHKTKKPGCEMANGRTTRNVPIGIDWDYR